MGIASTSRREPAALPPSAAVSRLAAGDRAPEVLRATLRARGDEQEELFALARRRRDERFPSRQVQVRSVVEISNTCRQGCKFCSMGPRSPQPRYVIGREELVELAAHLHARGRRHLLVQSGENPAPRYVEHVAACVEAVKSRHPDLHLILCLGNLRPDAYRLLRAAGADGYILKFETSNATLYSRWKPRDTLQRRLACLESLLREGFEAGSGNMVGLPGQTLDDLVGDLLLLGNYPLAMQSTTVFIPGEGCAYSGEPMGDLDTTLNLIATMRVLYPNRLIPTTSALERARTGGQRLGLLAGANTVTVHDGTPEALKDLFPIYSTKRFAPRGEHLEAAVLGAGLKLPGGAP